MRESIRQANCTDGTPFSELAEILAAGLLRLQSRKSSQNSAFGGIVRSTVGGILGVIVAGEVEVFPGHERHGFIAVSRPKKAPLHRFLKKRVVARSCFETEPPRL